MNKLTLLLPLAFVAQFTVAQSHIPVGLDAERNLGEISGNNTGAMIRTYDNRYEGVKGTPYFYEDWSKATITTNNTLLHNIDLKYNVYDNMVLYRNTKGEEFILELSKVDAFVLPGNEAQKEYTFKKFPVLATQDVGLLSKFAVALYEGKQFALVMVPEKQLKKADFKGAYNTGTRYDELVDVQTYFLIEPERWASKVKLNKRNLLKALPDKQDKVQEYINKNKIDVSTGAGWVKALAYYESL